MKHKFKYKKRRKYNKHIIYILIYISFSITYNTLYKHYIKTLSTEKVINKIIIDSQNNYQKTNFLDKYNNPEYLLKLTLNIDIYDQIEPIVQETLNNIEKKKNSTILIYNTHDTEKYFDNRFNNYNITPDVKLASNILEEKLNDLGISTYVIRTSIPKILKENNWTYAQSYQASRSLVEPLIKDNQYNLIIDLHRDSSDLSKTFLEYKNKPYAKILMVIGTDNTNYKENLNLSTKLNNILEQKIPGISRGITQKGGENVNGVYNQDLSSNLLIIEVGGQYNKIEDINNTIEILSEAILILLEGDIN